MAIVSLILQLLTAIILPSGSESLTILDSTCKRDDTVSVLLCLAYFTYCNALRVHPCCCQYQDLHLFKG